MDYKKILIFIFQILLRILGVGLLFLGLTGLPTMFSDGGVTTNIITLLLRLANVLSQIIVGYGLVRMKKWSTFGLIVLIIVSILIPFHNLYISTTPNIPQQSLSFSRALFFIIVYLITLFFKDKLFTRDNEIADLKLLIIDKYKIVFRLVGGYFLLTGLYVFLIYFFSSNFMFGGRFRFFLIPSTLRYFNVFIGIVIGLGLISLKKWSIYLIVLKLFLSIIDPIYFYNFYTSPFMFEFNFGEIAFFVFDILIDIVVLLFLTSLMKKSNRSQGNFEESEKLNNIGKNQQNRYGYLYKFSIFTAAVVIVCLLMVFIKNNNLNLSLNRNNIKYLTPTPTINSEKGDKTTHYDNIIVKNDEIVDTSQSPVFSTGLNLSTRFLYRSPNLVRWKNYLIGINIVNFVERVPNSTMNNKPTESTRLYNKIDSIRVYNLDSKESFNLQLEEPIIESYYGDVISQLFENKFYFGASSIEGLASFRYKLDLPPSKNSKIIKLPESIGNKIEKIGNVYISSACYEGCSYALFNPTSSSETVLTRMNKAANGYDEKRTEKLIGIDSRGRMIINSVKDNMIAAVPLTNEKLTIPLIKKDKLPVEITDYSMIDGIDKILMLGEDKAYIYNINQNKFEEIQIDQETNRWRYSGSNNNKVCLYSDQKQTSKTISVYSTVDMTTNKYLEVVLDNDCSPGRNTTVDDLFEELNLPDNYQLKDASLTFETYWRYL